MEWIIRFTRHVRKWRGRDARCALNAADYGRVVGIANHKLSKSRLKNDERKGAEKESLARPCHAQPRSDFALEISPREVASVKQPGTIAPTILRDYYDFSTKARATPSLAVSPSVLPPPRELAHREPHVQSEVTAVCALARWSCQRDGRAGAPTSRGKFLAASALSRHLDAAFRAGGKRKEIIADRKSAESDDEDSEISSNYSRIESQRFAVDRRSQTRPGYGRLRFEDGAAPPSCRLIGSAASLKRGTRFSRSRYLTFVIPWRRIKSSDVDRARKVISLRLFAGPSDSRDGCSTDQTFPSEKIYPPEKENIVPRGDSFNYKLRCLDMRLSGWFSSRKHGAGKWRAVRVLSSRNPAAPRGIRRVFLPVSPSGIFDCFFFPPLSSISK